MVTIRDIATRTGVSTSTVSRALNGSGYVAPATKQKIMAVVHDLDYVPSALAQDLSSGSAHNIGVVLPHMDHPYQTQLIKGIMTAAFASKYRVTLLPTAYDDETEVGYLEQLHRNQFDGLIFTSHGLPLSTLAHYQQYGPIVMCEHPETTDLAAVYSQRESTYREVFHWLKAQHADHLALLSYRPESRSATTQATMKAYRSVFNDAKPTTQFLTAVMTYEDGYRVGSQLTSAKYVLTDGDDVAAGVRQYLLDHHLPVPLLIGQENQLTGRLLGISTIDHHFETVGHEAFLMATGKLGKQRRVGIPSEFIIR